MPRAVTITGTRSTDHRPLGEYQALFREWLFPFAASGVRFYVGGARGIDSLSLLWLAAETEAELVVVVPGTLAGQPDDARQAVAVVRRQGRLEELIELDHPDHPSTEAYFHRNRWMVDRSEFVIGFPRSGSEGGGTWYTIGHAERQGKARLILPV
ncbi:hypothetical protein Sru01_40960 [Sphaerisporangium rufum]|uniref:DNA recombination-mediator protein A n=1 Tax=Sphaerisporangium rufum TaxID=1381558 RepID=A0A919R3X6_9ACTN|nr:hypothetical protein Sru01_40960 [Sphaerisporangium rufum]